MTQFPALHGLKFHPARFWADLSENTGIRADNIKVLARKADTKPHLQPFPVKVIPDDPDSRDAIKAIMVDVLCGGSGDGQQAERCEGISLHVTAVERANKILKALGWRAQKDHL
jgi:hypothetical protein